MVMCVCVFLLKIKDVTEEMFKQTFDTLKQSGNCFVFVIHDKTNDVIVGSATLLLEQKFTHTCGKVDFGFFFSIVIFYKFIYFDKQYGLFFFLKKIYLNIKVGHIEDVVTDKSCRGKGFGKM